MKTCFAFFVFLALFTSSLWAQEPEEFDGRPKQATERKEKAPLKIKAWQLVDNNSYADSIQLDTLLTGFQINNPAIDNNKFIIHTGNLGAPSQTYVLDKSYNNPDFIFTNNLDVYLPRSSTYTFYNTTRPYTNITYRQGAPKRLSEEHIKAIFTQNINKKANYGIDYQLLSSIGKYQAQRVDNEQINAWGSYDGERYSACGHFAANRTDQSENGGLENENALLTITEGQLFDSENIPVNFTSAKNLIKNYNFFYNHSLKLGRVKKDEDEIEDNKFAIGTVYHTIELNTYNRVYSIDNLQSQNPNSKGILYYPNVYADTIQTRDTSLYKILRNTFQLKLNEEANLLLRFGARAYLLNEIQQYDSQKEANPITNKNGVTTYYGYQQQRDRFTSTAIGGEIFKNEGKNLWWNAGLKVFFQGTKAGESELTGNLKSQFRVLRDTAGLFASGGIYLTKPGYYITNYYSNHFKWNNNYNDQKTLKIRGGIRIPTKRFELVGESRTINDYIYWNDKALPIQSDEVLQVVGINLNQHFKVFGFNSVNQVWWQATSNNKIMPLPTFSIYSSNFYENVIFKVLRFQIGADLKYHTGYYSPTYNPGTMQFYNQRIREVGNYPFIDVFANFHLKRARIGVMFEHLNYNYMGNDYFITQGYPNNPRGFKLAVSWNFYD